MRMTCLSLLLSLAGCVATGNTVTPCPDFSGSYLLDPQSCSTSRGALALAIEVAKYPDGSLIEREPVLLGIHQDGCARAGFVVRGAEEDLARLRRSFSAPLTVRAQNRVGGTEREWSNLPPPVAIGAHGDFFWRLERQVNGSDVLYTYGYAERGLFFLIPYSAHRTMTCRLTRPRDP